MSRIATLAVAVAALSLATPAAAAEPIGQSGFTLNASLAGGPEVGLDRGKAGVLELEAVPGYELGLGFRGEVGLAIGLEPDTHFAIRPGVRWSVPETPFQLRAALDAANSRQDGLHWRWLMVGIAAELRFTGALGLFGEVDTGAPLDSAYGVPLLFRGGISLRF